MEEGDSNTQYTEQVATKSTGKKKFCDWWIKKFSQPQEDSIEDISDTTHHT